jgi:hypothetical protein
MNWGEKQKKVMQLYEELKVHMYDPGKAYAQRSVVWIHDGGMLSERELKPQNKDRVETGVKLARASHTDYVCMSGGSAQAMADYAIRYCGLNASHVMTETKSSDTMTSLYALADMADRWRWSSADLLSNWWHPRLGILAEEILKPYNIDYEFVGAPDRRGFNDPSMVSDALDESWKLKGDKSPKFIRFGGKTALNLKRKLFG